MKNKFDYGSKRFLIDNILRYGFHSKKGVISIDTKRLKSFDKAYLYFPKELFISNRNTHYLPTVKSRHDECSTWYLYECLLLLECKFHKISNCFEDKTELNCYFIHEFTVEFLRAAINMMKNVGRCKDNYDYSDFYNFLKKNMDKGEKPYKLENYKFIVTLKDADNVLKHNTRNSYEEFKKSIHQFKMESYINTIHSKIDFESGDSLKRILVFGDNFIEDMLDGAKAFVAEIGARIFNEDASTFWKDQNYLLNQVSKMIEDYKHTEQA